MTHLSNEHVAPVDRDLAARARSVDEWSRSRTVNEIDDNGVVVQALDLERYFVAVAADGSGIHHNVVTFSVEVTQGNVRQTE